MKNIAAWVVTILVALAFVGAGFAKLSSQPMMIEEFGSFGYPLWFMYVTGAIEIAGAVLALVPRTSFVGVGLLICVMIGALLTHLTHGQAGKIGAPAVLLVLLLVIVVLRGWRLPARA